MGRWILTYLFISFSHACIQNIPTEAVQFHDFYLGAPIYTQLGSPPDAKTVYQYGEIVNYGYIPPQPVESGDHTKGICLFFFLLNYSFYFCFLDRDESPSSFYSHADEGSDKITSPLTPIISPIPTAVIQEESDMYQSAHSDLRPIPIKFIIPPPPSNPPPENLTAPNINSERTNSFNSNSTGDRSILSRSEQSNAPSEMENASPQTPSSFMGRLRKNVRRRPSTDTMPPSSTSNNGKSSWFSKLVTTNSKPGGETNGPEVLNPESTSTSYTTGADTTNHEQNVQSNKDQLSLAAIPEQQTGVAASLSVEKILEYVMQRIKQVRNSF
jgi:hypothetical protein